MTTDTKAIIATIVGTGIAIAALTISGFALLSDRIGNVETEIRATRTELGARIDTTRAELGARIDAARAELDARIDAARAELDARIDAARAELGARIDHLAERMRNIEEGLARTDQRLDILERAIIPPAE